ncbi:MAG: hypothetical protein A3H70_00505 [Candidatus Komeilibacteria bacterium RIFCSPLOWO2_02_FULL_48_11]|uniref:Uncharacterized protein n=1 Tax=Candidatus Komeilibacteria bacterium RIFCSPLOWO2_02_FULL_48_11 TaxID=1798553 RepID=A0A1G2BU13_9BACT|nr:MAG: hypothetical protein A3H70_00505 [Candidatus Komeilibacteria bacterium RIFCSPLOWO2_02_FULL_48_11]
METIQPSTYFANFLSDSSSAMVLEQAPDLTLMDDRLKLLFLDRWHSRIRIYPEEWVSQDNTVTLPARLSDPLYGQDMLDSWINEKARYAPTIERVREITAKLPSLTKLLLDDRNNE